MNKYQNIWIFRSFIWFTVVSASVVLLSCHTLKVFASEMTLPANKTQAQILSDFAKSKRWTRLLYYNPKGVSKVDSPDFFLSPQGRQDPLAELQESYKQMFLQPISEINDEHAICKFPARFYYLDKKLKKNQFHKIKYCPKFLNFISRATGNSISLVFSSYNLSSPSSAFGHTFLKINKHDRQSSDLLNYGINYAADVPAANNAAFYALQGLMGFFQGKFTAVPFYYKIREYNDFESRDIWEYELNLSHEEVQLLTMHFWELGRAWAWYYFLDENCSYWAIKSLQAIALDLNFDEDLDDILVIPVETIKALYRHEDLVKEVYYRPSLRKRLNLSLDAFTKNQRRMIEDLSTQVYVGDTDSLQNINNYTVEALDAAILYFDYKYSKDYISDEKKALAKKQPLLVARSKKPSATQKDTQISQPSRPEKIHPPRRLDLGFENSDQAQAFSFSYKMGFHELIDSTLGMEAPLAMNYFDLGFNIYQLEGSSQWKFNLDKFDILRIDALMPTSSFDKRTSWRLKIGITEDLYMADIESRVGRAQIDGGFTWSLTPSQRTFIYLLVSNGVESSVRFASKFRLNVAPLIGARIGWSPNFNSMIELKHHWFWQTDDVWQKKAVVELQNQYYFPRLKLAAYFNSEFFHLNESGQNHEDLRWNIGLRHYF